MVDYPRFTEQGAQHTRQYEREGVCWWGWCRHPRNTAVLPRLWRFLPRPYSDWDGISSSLTHRPRKQTRVNTPNSGLQECILKISCTLLLYTASIFSNTNVILQHIQITLDMRSNGMRRFGLLVEQDNMKGRKLRHDPYAALFIYILFWLTLQQVF